MKLLRLVRTAPFRLAMAYAVMFSISAGLIFAVLYIQVVTQVKSHLRNSIKDEIASLIEESGMVGGLPIALQQHLRLSNEQFDYLLLDSHGKPLQGAWANPPQWQAGWQVVNPPYPHPHSQTDKADDVVLAKATPMPDGTTLVVGRPMKSLIEIQEIILEAFGIGGGLILLLSIGGGFLMSAGFLRQIDRFNATAARVMDGNLGERIPVNGTKDAFDQLAANLNLMLERVESFMEGMRQVTNDIAHDLRTPLTRLRQNLEGAARKASSVQEFQVAVGKAIVEADDVLATFTGMLRISQIEAGSGGMEATSVNLSALCHQILEIYEPLARDKNTRLTSQITENTFLTCNERLLTQLLANLMDNALNHTPQGTDITVELATRNGMVILGVSDHGPGIPEPERERVIKRFVRLERSRNTPGNGLGLALVVAVAGRYGGSLALSDNNPGLRAEVSFPIAL